MTQDSKTAPATVANPFFIFGILSYGLKMTAYIIDNEENLGKVAAMRIYTLQNLGINLLIVKAN